MGLFDTHTHLESFHRKGELEAALQRAVEAGVSRMTTVGTDPEDWALYAKLSERWPNAVSYTIGLHPCSVESNWRHAVSQIEPYLKLDRAPVAIGEIGLDRFHLPKDEAAAEEIHQEQLDAFRAQLEIAKASGARVVIHSRGAFDECVAEVDASGIDWGRVVFHCFSEGAEAMQKLIDRGGYGSFTGIITFKNAAEVREAAVLQGLDRLMIETDAPYLAPMPHRGKPNEPAYLAHTARYCAELFGVSEAELAAKTLENGMRFYGIE